jgi:type II secretory pathway pseudopilin PulG
MEILVALGILGVIGVGLLAALNTNSRATRTLDEQVKAANLAVAYIEVIKESSYAAAYPSAGDNITLPAQYEVVVETQCSSDGTNFSDCTGSDNETLQKIIAIVSRDGKPVLSLCTYRTKR